MQCEMLTESKCTCIFLDGVSFHSAMTGAGEVLEGHREEWEMVYRRRIWHPLCWNAMVPVEVCIFLLLCHHCSAVCFLLQPSSPACRKHSRFTQCLRVGQHACRQLHGDTRVPFLWPAHFDHSPTWPASQNNLCGCFLQHPWDRGPCHARGAWWYFYFFFCNHHGWIWSLACSLNHPSLRSSPDPTALWGKAENADSSAFSSKREEQGRFPLGLAVTLPAQGSGVAFMMLLATLSQGWDELALHKQECHRQW